MGAAVLYATLSAAVPLVPVDRVEAAIDARVADDLETVEVTAEYRLTATAALDRIGVVLAADRYRTPPEPLLPAAEREVFPGGVDEGGFDDVAVTVNGRDCRPETVTLAQEARMLFCPGRLSPGEAVEVMVRATLTVPERYGPFGRIGRQVTLAGAWYPYLARPDGRPARGRHRIRVSVPEGMGAVVGSAVFPPIPSGRRTFVQEEETGQVALVVLPPFVTLRSVGPFRFVRRPPLSDPEVRRNAQVEEALRDALRFLLEEGRPPKAPLLVVEAPLRHNLARATEGPVLISDRAFRIFPMDRFFAFHRYPVLRELFTGLALRDHPHVTADAIGGWTLDRYVASRVGRAEDAFDVLSFWSFIPAVDSLLYAPQLPFVGAYFRLIEEEDPLRPNLIDFPDPKPRGKILYEKLLDRLGRRETDRVFSEVLAGEPLDKAIGARLGPATEGFLATWLGPYPDVRYRLLEHDSVPCGDGCFEARVRIERDGDRVAEPIQVRLEDDDGNERFVWSEPTADAVRVVTATLAAPLSEVTLDPNGRLAETPSAEVPSPKLDNVSDPRWRFLLNNFNVLLAASAGQIDTALDVGFSRVRDVRWRFAARGAFSPASVSLSGRATRYFGHAVTPDSLSQWIGLTVAGEYLRPEFSEVSEAGFALSGALYYGYDDRRTVWAPESGTGLRLALDYSHVFGAAGDPDATSDSVAVTARALRSFRIGASHQISLRGSIGAYVYGRPRDQLLYSLGGRRNVRGYDVGEAQAKMRGIGSVEWVHQLVNNENTDFLDLVWVTGIDGALFGDVAVLGEDPGDVADGPVFADVGYGLRFYIDYFGVRPGVMAIDLAIPLVDLDGRLKVQPPAIYVDFAQSFLAF